MESSLLYQILGQALGFVATALTCISYQVNTKQRVLIVQTAATACTCVSYLFLGATAGFFLNIGCIVRNVLFFIQEPGTKRNTVTAVVLALVMGGLGVLSWTGPMMLLIILPLMANTVFLSFGRPQLLRQSVLVTSTLILIYNALIPAFGGILNEGISVLSSAIGIIRYRKRRTASALRTDASGESTRYKKDVGA